MSTKVVTPKFRVSFPHVFEPQVNQDSGKKQYSIVMLFEQDADLSELKKIAKEAKVEKWADKPPANFQTPFKDGNTKDYSGYEDTIFINAKSISSPGIVDESKQPILDREEFYAGCYARATITAYAWTYMGKHGVSFGLQNLQKMNDGEPFSGKTKAEDDFETIAVADEDGTAELNSVEGLDI